MRIISGEKKGLRLKAVPGMNTRPTTDRVKESVFNIIGPYFADCYVLDLFAGSGALGIEAVSRGAARSVFVDNATVAINTIQENLRLANVIDRAEVLKSDWKSACDKLASKGYSFDLVFLDPPYQQFENQIETILQTLLDKELLNRHAKIICEQDSKSNLPLQFMNLSGKYYKYGNTGITVFYKEENEE
ncbi:16S rRNA (guanine(966)-N(2))-methyltransferase RsmD [Desulfuribacillus stibiiarsenatis]|uniref:16S rRNA (Guanine(966)-N(2))-methyltransferase RsmD n=1 Tax=Desulfuribacillus stibiiarsenatis TaxID=1390249 RepID=A0A1E5L6I1_9FIRM|nr:16S rRNA (guanine(966)-N(2))-methyltransferase RsmD [Desulfuribacillus stibiiarsenatis]OEH85767.1 16S rRNA (guanine(966)-N(2))-methyltransferase RsmD [Desulfuribacillus stibiiarsenatis]